MGYDPILVAETRGWLAKAAEDLATADFELTAKPPFTADIAFHAQQAAEKCLKGFLTWNGQTFRKTHSLEAIGEQCIGVDTTLAELIRSATPLTEYAWKFRYPGELVKPDVKEAEEALATARLVYKSILSRLPDEVSP